MNLSKDSLHPKNVRFAEVAQTRAPSWLEALRGEPLCLDFDRDVAPLTPPRVPSGTKPAHAPSVESVRPPPRSSPPLASPHHEGRSLTPARGMAVPGRQQSQYPANGDVALGMDAGSPAGRERRRDTLVEDLVPRAEEEAVQAISAAVEQFAAERARALESAERELVELVRVICRRVILREVSLHPEVVHRLVQAGLEALGRGDRVTVRLGPFFSDSRDHIASELSHKGVDCTIVIDPSVGAHGCQLETQLGRVDESVETRLDVLLRSVEVAP